MQIFRQRAADRDRAGSALLASLLVATVVAMLTAAMMQLSAASWGRSKAAVDGKKAFYVAEAGLAEGIFSLVTGGTGNVATEEAPARFGEGVFWVDAVENEYGLVMLECTALCKQSRTKLSVVLQRQAQPLGQLGFYGEQGIEVGAGVQIGAYNSVEANGGVVGDLLGGLPGDTTPPARIGTNGDVVVGDNAVVDGDATPGRTGSVSLGVGASVTGSTAPRTAPAVMPEITVPTAEVMGDMVVAAGDALTTEPTVAEYRLLDVQQNSRFQVVGPTILVADHLRLRSGATLVADVTNGPVWLYVKGRFVVDTGAQVINLQEDPRRLSVLVSGSDPAPGTVGRPAVALNGQGVFHGQIFAPGAAVTIPSAMEVYGAVAAEQLTLAPDARLTYDQALLVGDGGGVDLDLVSWRFVDPPRAVSPNLRYDPVVELESAGVVLERPAARHQLADLIVEYVGWDGEVYRFKGDPGDFDASVVQVELDRALTGDLNYDTLNEPLQLKLLQRLLNQ